jgi:hypothetical protein
MGSVATSVPLTGTLVIRPGAPVIGRELGSDDYSLSMTLKGQGSSLGTTVDLDVLAFNASNYHCNGAH